MGYKSTEEMINAFKEFANGLQKIPTSFPVHNDYLIDGMNESAFIEGYKAYRDLLFNIYEDMCENPDDYGMFTIDKKNNKKPAYHYNYPYLWLFLAASHAGKIENDILYVNGKLFHEFKKGKAVGTHSAVPKSIDKLMNKLNGFNVLVDGYEEDKPSDFTISAKTPRLMTAIKASTLSQYAKKSTICDYGSFNVNLYAIGATEKIPFDKTATFLLMPKNRQDFGKALLSALEKAGIAFRAERHHTLTDGRLTFKGIEYYYSVANAHFVYISGGGNHIDYIEQLPPNYYDKWVSTVKCKGCKKGDCSYRRINMLKDKKFPFCGSAKIVYEDNIEDIPHIVEAVLVMAKEK